MVGRICIKCHGCDKAARAPNHTLCGAAGCSPPLLLSAGTDGTALLDPLLLVFVLFLCLTERAWPSAVGFLLAAPSPPKEIRFPGFDKEKAELKRV